MPRAGRNQVLALTRDLLRPVRPRGTVTALGGLLETAVGMIRRRSLIGPSTRRSSGTVGDMALAQGATTAGRVLRRAA